MPEPQCYDCHEPIVFDWNRKGKNQRPIPLDPDTKEPHKCKEQTSTPKEPIKANEDNFQTQSGQSDKRSFDEVAKEIKEEKKNGKVGFDEVSRTVEKEAQKPTLPMDRIIEEPRPEPEKPKTEYVDHTLAGIPQVITIVGETPEEMDDFANSWLKKNHEIIKFKGGQRVSRQDDRSEITLYFEQK